jgi:hypothetical protein
MRLGSAEITSPKRTQTVYHAQEDNTMTITVTFESIDEMLGTLNVTREEILAATVGYEKPKKKKAEVSAPVAAPVPKAEPAPALAEPEPAPKAEEAPAVEVTDEYRLKVRQTLHELNKKTGKNTATELIKSFGVSKFTEMAPVDLPALMAKAEEALNA